MLSQNVINSNKKGAIKGKIFHLFYPDLNNSILFDSDLSEPIIWGSKNVVMANAIKKLDDLMNQPKTTTVRIYSYIMGQDGFRRIDTYNGPIETISKYIRRY